MGKPDRFLGPPSRPAREACHAGVLLHPKHQGMDRMGTRVTLRPRPSLTPLQGHVSAIHNSSFFHLFDREYQVIAAKALASLLSPDPGSMIFGEHTTLPESGDCFNSFRQTTMECIGPSDWEKLWKGIFSGGAIEVETTVRKLRMDEGTGIRQDVEGGKWCVRRLCRKQCLFYYSESLHSINLEVG